MIAQYRPDIARALEETVTNLKELENRLDVLRTDLAWVAQTLGHPQAAAVAIQPSRNLLATAGIPNFATSMGIPSLGISPSLGFVNPLVGQGAIGQVPFVGQGFGVQNPFMSQGFGVQNPFMSQAAINPYAIAAGIPSAWGSPYALGPIGIPGTHIGYGAPTQQNPYAATLNPFATTPFGAVPGTVTLVPPFPSPR